VCMYLKRETGSFLSTRVMKKIEDGHTSKEVRGESTNDTLCVDARTSESEGDEGHSRKSESSPGPGSADTVTAITTTTTKSIFYSGTKLDTNELSLSDHRFIHPIPLLHHCPVLFFANRLISWHPVPLAMKTPSPRRTRKWRKEPTGPRNFFLSDMLD
jgi:hypothetical protein